uniref:Putative glycosyltransferase n=1 Tax=viral metagenome TaxID=1070528 RepID=A0A6M3KET0_9ZZZZ
MLGMVSFCIPSVRPDGLSRTLRASLNSTRYRPLEFVVATESEAVLRKVLDFREEVGEEDGVIVRYSFAHERSGPNQAWNDALQASEGEYICFWSDDVVPHEGYIEKAMPYFERFPGGIGYVGFNDMINNGNNLTTFYIAHREHIIKVNHGVLAYPHYQRIYNDTESMFRAKRANRWVWAEDAVTEHMHPAARKREVDEWDELMTAAMQPDGVEFNRRLALGFPNDFEPAITE